MKKGMTKEDIEKALKSLDDPYFLIKYPIYNMSRKDLEELGFKNREFGGYGDDTATFPIAINSTGHRMLETEPVFGILKESHMGGNYGRADEYLLFKEFKWGCVIINMQYYGDSSFKMEQVFKGQIKNKSELKKLLKQLGIKDEA